MVFQAMPQRWSPKQPGRVLVVEDDPEMRALMTVALHSSGYEVTEASDGAEALRLLGRVDGREGGGSPDLIVSDVKMPRCTGMEMLEQLFREQVGIPVILVTAFGDWATHARAEQLGAQVLDKPFSLDDLLKRVFEALELG
jgi:DNA-binding response OmpR family regulator